MPRIRFSDHSVPFRFGDTLKTATPYVRRRQRKINGRRFYREGPAGHHWTDSVILAICLGALAGIVVALMLGKLQ